MQYEKIKKGQEIKLEISDLAFGGQGISKINDLIVFVKNAIPGQTVLAKVIKSKKKYIEAYKLEVLNKSSNEVVAECEHFKFCGGCTIQQMKYEKQLFYKQKQVSEIFNKIGRINNPQINSIIIEIKCNIHFQIIPGLLMMSLMMILL
jgi:23S rRNA (uracil1939-C5)-methyltransferase